MFKQHNKGFVYILHTALRIVAAVYETLSPFMTEMKEDLAAVKTEVREGLAAFRENLTSIKGQVNSLTETVSGLSKNQSNPEAIKESVLQGIFPLINNLEQILEEKLVSFTQELQNTAIEYAPPLYGCGGTGGWRRVVYMDMTDPNTNCPCGWNLITSPKRTCGKVNTSSLSCDSVFFPVIGGNYTSVCGSIRAYQCDIVDAFEAYHDGHVTTIEEAYVAGVSLTHGKPRQHIWTFAAGASEAQPTWNDVCPCDASINITIPPFVGGNYFCESGTTSNIPDGLYPDDPLWDGEGCSSSSSCCSLNNPPYFSMQLPSPTSDPIEARLCRWEKVDDSPVEFMELYVK